MSADEATTMALMGLPANFGVEQPKKKKKGGRGKKKPAQDASPYDKYYAQRYQYFSLFDYGVMIDEVGWYSVTPEEISVHVAKRCACNVIIDAFCGVGGNAIHFAKTCNFVIAVDLDPIRLACARHNASIYGVEHKIEFVLGSYLDVIPRANADVVFLAPPWGGPDYVHADVFDIDTMIPLHGSKLYQQTRAITPNICYQLPKNCDKKKVAQLARLGAIGVSNNLEGTDGTGAGVNAPAGDSVCEIEDNYLGESLKMMTAYFGNLVAPS